MRLGAHAGPLRSWVVDVKHAGWESMAETLGAALGQQLLDCGLISRGDRDVLIVPVPSPWLRTHIMAMQYIAHAIDRVPTNANAHTHVAHIRARTETHARTHARM